MSLRRFVLVVSLLPLSLASMAAADPSEHGVPPAPVAAKLASAPAPGGDVADVPGVTGFLALTGFVAGLGGLALLLLRGGRPGPTASSSPQVRPEDANDPVSDLPAHTSILELAEMLQLFGKTKGAVKTLTDYIDARPHHSLQPSLKLLDVYRAAGMKNEFEILAGRLNQSFNVKAASWQGAEQKPQSLENFPHILARISASWGRPECLDYLRRLLQDNRYGSRSGFPLDVLNELLLLEQVLESRQESTAS